MEDILVSSSSNLTSLKNVHLLPCDILYDGPARVSNYFVPKIADDGSITCHFRGRKLAGKKYSLPQGTVGLLIVESTPSSRNNFTSSTQHNSVSSKNSRSRTQSSLSKNSVGKGNLGDQLLDEDDDDDDSFHFAQVQFGTSQSPKDSEDEEIEAMSRKSKGSVKLSPPLQKQYVVKSSFSDIMDWKYGLCHTSHDLIPSLTNWLEVSNALHS